VRSNLKLTGSNRRSDLGRGRSTLGLGHPGPVALPYLFLTQAPARGWGFVLFTGEARLAGEERRRRTAASPDYRSPFGIESARGRPLPPSQLLAAALALRCTLATGLLDGTSAALLPVCTGRARIEAPRQTRLTFSTKDVTIKASDPLASARCDIEVSDCGLEMYRETVEVKLRK
jgi:hypothetical protein